MYIEIDNPSGGDCAFYAYAIALIDIIKHEFYKNPVYSPIFRQWCQDHPELIDYKAKILSFNYRDQDCSLLKTLQKSLRKIVFFHQVRQLDELEKADNIMLKTLQLPVFCRFSEIFWHYYLRSQLNPDYNILSRSAKVNDLLKEKAKDFDKIIPRRVYASPQHDELINSYLADIFLREIYGDHYQDKRQRSIGETSIIIQGLTRVRADRECAIQNKVPCYWGTHGDLVILSEAFGVSLHYLVNGREIQQFADTPGTPVAIINNLGNAHWVTRIVMCNLEDTSRTQRYLSYATDTLLNKAEILQLFHGYTKGYTSFFRRHHLSIVGEIMEACNNPEKSVDNVIQLIKDYIKNPRNHFNRGDGFMKRVDYILARNENYAGAEVKEHALPLV